MTARNTSMRGLTEADVIDMEPRLKHVDARTVVLVPQPLRCGPRTRIYKHVHHITSHHVIIRAFDQLSEKENNHNAQNDKAQRVKLGPPATPLSHSWTCRKSRLHESGQLVR